MGRDRDRKQKRQRSLDGPEERRPNVDVEVLIAHDPALGLDSDEEVDLGGSVVSFAGSSHSRSSGGGRGGGGKDSSGAGSSSNQKQRRKREKKEKKKVDVNEDGVDNEEVFYVEKIKDKRWNTALQRYEYLLQWQGYGPEHDTWEPTENMDCDDLLLEFETEWNKKPRFRFDRGEMPREIVGLVNVEGSPKFVLLYRNSDDAEFVTKEECYQKCPNLVIEFFESRQIAKPGEDLDFDSLTLGTGQGAQAAAETPSTSASTEVTQPQTSVST